MSSRTARPETTAAKRQRERSDRRSTGVQVYDRTGPRVRHLPVVADTPPRPRPSCPTPCRWWAAPASRVEDYVYREGAGALAHADRYRERWGDEPRGRRAR